MAGVTIVLPVLVTCDHCSATFERGAELPIDAGESFGRVIRKMRTRELRAAIAAHAEAEGWLIGRGEAYCPECATLLKAGSISPHLSGTGTFAMIDQLAFARKVKKAKKTQKEVGDDGSVEGDNDE